MRTVLIASIVGCAIFGAFVVWSTIPIPTILVQFGGFLSGEPDRPVKHTLFTGDVFLGRAVERWQQRNPDTTSFTYLQSTFKTYEHVLINFESAIPATHVPTPDFGFQFSVPTSSLRMLRSSGVSHVGVANNHTYDFGQSGYDHTIQSIRTAGLVPVRDDNVPTYSSVGDTLIGIIAVSYVGATPDTAAVLATIEDVRAQDAVPVVYVHWGVEYEQVPSSRQRVLAEQMVEAGARLIIGHHPHVVQSIERLGDAIVLYSLGNTVFDQYFSYSVQEGLLAGLEVSADGLAIQLLPISSVQTRHQPQLLTDTARSDFLADLSAISDPLLASAITAGRIALP